MDSSKFEKYKNAKHYKDGETIRGKWAGKRIVVRKPHYDVMVDWQKKSGLPKSLFFRKALLMGAVLLARQLQVGEELPELED